MTLLRRGLVVVAALLVLPPAIVIAFGSIRSGRTLNSGNFTLQNYLTILTTDGMLRSLYMTVAFSVVTTTVTIVLAAFVSWIAERTNAPGRGFITVMTAAAFAVPHFVMAMGWILVLGPNSGLVNFLLRQLFGEDAYQFDLFTFTGMIVVESMTLLPLAVLLLRPAFRATNPEHEEAARASGANQWQTFRRVTAPMSRPAVLAAGFLCLVLTVQAFEVPNLIGVRAKVSMLSTEIFQEVNRPRPNYGIAAAFAAFMVVLTLIGLAFYRRATSDADRFAKLTGKSYRASVIELGRLRWLFGGINIVIGALVLAPVAILVWASLFPVYTGPDPRLSPAGLGFGTYQEVLAHPVALRAAANTVVVGLIGAAVVLLITLLTAWVGLRSPGPAQTAADQLLSLPLVIPGMVLALALIHLFVSLPFPLYGTFVIVILAFVIHYMPYGMRFNQAGLSNVHRELEEAVFVSGGSRLTGLRRVVLPLLLPSLLAGGLFIVLGSIRQLSLVVLLSGPGTELVGPEIFNMWQLGSFSLAAAYAVLVATAALLVLGVVFLTARLLGRRAAGMANDLARRSLG